MSVLTPMHYRWEEIERERLSATIEREIARVAEHYLDKAAKPPPRAALVPRAHSVPPPPVMAVLGTVTDKRSREEPSSRR